MAEDDPAAGVLAKYQDSVELTMGIQEAIIAGGGKLDMKELNVTRKVIKRRREKGVMMRAQEIREGLAKEDPLLRKALEVASEKGASGVFSVRPLEEFGFASSLREILEICWR